MRRKPKKITESYLRNLLAWYLDRHDAPKAHIRRLMMQRVNRAVAFHDQDRDEAVALLDDALTFFERSGLIDDARWGELAIERWRRRGVSQRVIRGRLSAKGVSHELIQTLLRPDHDAEHLAALRLARRRRIGPWNPDPSDDHDLRRKHLGILGRAGFSYDLARRVLDETDREAMEDLLLAHR